MLHYSGESAAGQTLPLTLQGRRVAAIDGSILTTCVPTHGTPVTYTVAFDPPGSFALGTPARKATKVEHMAYEGDVTKYFKVHLTRLRKRIWKADLDVSFSSAEVMYGGFGELEQRFFICQGDDEFLFRV